MDQKNPFYKAYDLLISDLIKHTKAIKQGE